MPRPFALGPTPQSPDAFVDETVAGARVDRVPAFVRGWAAFPAEPVERVELTLDGHPLGLANVGLPRPDVADILMFPDAPTSGWDFELVGGWLDGQPGSASLDEPEAGVVVDRLPRYVR